MTSDGIARFFEQEMPRCYPYMRAHARKYLKNEEVIKDIVQESWLKLYYRLIDLVTRETERISQMEPVEETEENLSRRETNEETEWYLFRMGDHYAWLKTVIKNAALDYHKEQKRLQQLDPAEALAILEIRGGSEPSPEMTLTYRETQEDLIALLQTIPFKQRKVLYQNLYLGMSFEEIARGLALSPNTIRSWYFRGKKSLKQIVTRKVTPADLLLLIEHSVMREES